MASIDDWIFTREYIEYIENNDESVPRILQKEYRSKSVWFMEDLAKTLKIDRKVLSTACIYFHRFYMLHSFASHNRYSLAVASIFLASKVEDKAIKIRDLLAAYQAVLERQPEADIQSKVLLAERILLHTLSFDLNVIHPYASSSFKVREIKGLLSEEMCKSLYQTAVNFMNDCYRSTLYLQYKGHEVGLSCLFLATIYLVLPPPSETTIKGQIQAQTWIEIFARDISEGTIREICFEILNIYNNNAYYLKLEGHSFFQENAYKELGAETSYQTEMASGITSVSMSPSSSHITAMNEDWSNDEDGRWGEEIENSKVPTVKVSKVVVPRKEEVEVVNSSDLYDGLERDGLEGDLSPSSNLDTPFYNQPPADTPSGTGEYAYDEESTPYISATKSMDTPNSPNGFADVPSFRMRDRSLSTGDDSVTDYKRARYE